MQRAFVYVLGLTAHLLGCASEPRQAGSTTDHSAAAARKLDAATPAQRDDHSDAQDAAAKGSADAQQEPDAARATSQCDVQQCERQAMDLAQSLMAPAEVALTVKGNECIRVDIAGVVAGMACTCLSSNGWLYIGPEGAGCFARGRAGDCLWDDSEYEPCSTEDDKCPELCTELATRYKADAAATFDAELRSSTCGTDGFCHRVLRVEDRCYADASLEKARSYDCALSDEEILDQDKQALEMDRQISSCTSPMPDPSTCRAITPPAPEECAPRPAEEWQGLPVCPPRPPCTKSENCSFALACVDGKCDACTSDEQCAPGEGCVLDHCVQTAQISCHVRADCPEGELCILSGISNGLRGNADMRAYCQGPLGGASHSPRR